MAASANNIISIQQFNLYKEAKSIVRSEFNHKLKLSERWQDDVKMFVVLTGHERLTELYNNSLAA